MPGLHNLVATALATDAAAVTGIAGSSPTPIETLPGTPYVVIGPPRGQIVTGSWERMFLVYPMHLFYARVQNPNLDQTSLNDYCDLFITQFRTGITMGVAGVVEAVIASWDTNKEMTVGDEDYQLIEFLVSVEVDRAATYTP